MTDGFLTIKNELVRWIDRKSNDNEYLFSDIENVNEGL